MGMGQGLADGETGWLSDSSEGRVFDWWSCKRLERCRKVIEMGLPRLLKLRGWLLADQPECPWGRWLSTDVKSPVYADNINIIKLAAQKMTVGKTLLTSFAILNRALPASKRSSLLMYGCLTDVVLACVRISIMIVSILQRKKKKELSKATLTHDRMFSDWVGVVIAACIGSRTGRWARPLLVIGAVPFLNISSARRADFFFEDCFVILPAFGPRCMRRAEGTTLQDPKKNVTVVSNKIN